MRSAHGFTLIELIVVIVIIGILATFAVLSINRTDPDSATACRSDLHAWLAAQSVMAQSTGSVVYVRNDGQTPTAFTLRATTPDTPRSAAPTPSPVAPAVALSATPVGTLDWPRGCRLLATPNPHAALAANDPRQRAVLAVTPGGQWSLPPGSVTGASPAISAAPDAGLRLKIAGQGNSQAELDLNAPTPAQSTAPTP